MVETFTATALSPWYRLELFVSPAQQLLLTDLLMAMTDVHGFFQQRIDSFSDRQGSMTTSEQVAGRRALVLVVLYSQDPWGLIAALRANPDSQALPLHFAISPLLAHGQLHAS